MTTYAHRRKPARSFNHLSLTADGVEMTASDSLFSEDSSKLRKRSRQDLRKELEQEADIATDFIRSKRKRPEPLSLKSSLATVSLPPLGSPFANETQFSFQTPIRKQLDASLGPTPSSRHLKENAASTPRGLDSPFHTRPDSPAGSSLGSFPLAQSHSKKTENRSRTRRRPVHSKSRTLSADRGKGTHEPPPEIPAPRAMSHMRGRLSSLPDISPQIPVAWLNKGLAPGPREIPRELSHTPSFQGASHNSPFRRSFSDVACATPALLSGNDIEFLYSGNLLSANPREDVVMDDDPRCTQLTRGFGSDDDSCTPPASIAVPSAFSPAELVASFDGLGLGPGTLPVRLTRI
jgi:hypothetical protein